MNCSAAYLLVAATLLVNVPSGRACLPAVPALTRQNPVPTKAMVRVRRAHAQESLQAKSQPSPGAGFSSASQQSVQPAVVTLQKGLLTVSAHNSDLSQILHQIAQSSGMTIDGSVQGVKVFGQYGPADSKDVLKDLLEGLGYNFVMTGHTDQGAPKELVLTAQTGGMTPAPIPAPSNARTQALNSDGTVVDEDHPGPGAIVNVPPPPSDDTQERVQQHLQRLEQMRQPPQSASSPQ